MNDCHSRYGEPELLRVVKRAVNRRRRPGMRRVSESLAGQASAEYGKKARAGLLLHTGSVLEWLAPDVLAAPWWRVL